MEQYGICNLPLVPVRAGANDKSEMLTQLLFGESFTVLNTEGSWVNIKTAFDDYEGWIDFKQYKIITQEEYSSCSENLKVLGLSAAHKITRLSSGEIMNVPAGSSIPQANNRQFFIGDDEYLLSEDLERNSTEFETVIPEFARFFLNAPYLWGGKSLFGIDCSGLTQVVFKMYGIKIKRDAWQQAEQGTAVNFLQEARIGDLAFFDNSEGKITHAGIMLNDQKIIHASGRVKIDPIDDQGIYSLDLKKHTHRLRIIKRYY